jgi:hypothetical protein
VKFDIQEHTSTGIKRNHKFLFDNEITGKAVAMKTQRYECALNILVAKFELR